MSSRSNRGISLAQKIEILFSHSQATEVEVTCRKVAEATGESMSSIHNILFGRNSNPRIQIIMKIADYFGVDLKYFECTSEAECRAFLEGAQAGRVAYQSETSFSEPAQHAHGLSGRGLEFVLQAVTWLRRAEGLPDLDGC